MATADTRQNAPVQPQAPQGEVLYDAQFGIEAMQHEPYESGFTWRTVLGALFIAFVMLPGVIFMGLMIGSDIGTAADWVTIILFVELARRSFIVLRKQELYILKYTVSHLSHASGGLMLGGGMFASLVAQRYMRSSEAFQNFGITYDVPRWYAPYGDAAASNNFLSEVWMPVVTVIVLSMVLTKLTSLSLGFLIYKVVSDVEQLPFPLAPIHAEGAIALAESSQDGNKKGFRQYCFSIGVMIGAVFALFYMGIPTLTEAFLGKSVQLIPIPFWDMTEQVASFWPAVPIGLTLNIALLFTGFVLPWRIVVGMFTSCVLFQFVVNPFVFRPMGLLPHWTPGKDAIMTQFATSLDIYLSAGIGFAFAIFVVGVVGLVKGLIKYSRASKSEEPMQMDLRKLFQRDVERGDPPIWVPVAVWVGSAIGFIVLSNYLVNVTAPAGTPVFSIWWLIAFAFFWTPINSYINARMAGIAGQHAEVPYIRQSAIFLSGYSAVNIWFAPMPLANYGGMSTLLRETQLTRTKFTSIMKAELLIFPLMLVASFIFWSYIANLGPVPSENYPYAQKFWPQAAYDSALWAASKQEGQSLLMESIKPWVIFSAFGIATALFSIFGMAGISLQYLYGGLGGVHALPHSTLMVFLGAVLGRFVFARKFGKEKWQNYTPILAVGVGAGMGLVGMLSIAINFLWKSIGTGY
jgi:hypothetical protein